MFTAYGNNGYFVFHFPVILKTTKVLSQEYPVFNLSSASIYVLPSPSSPKAIMFFIQKEFSGADWFCCTCTFIDRPHSPVAKYYQQGYKNKYLVTWASLVPTTLCKAAHFAYCYAFMHVSKLILRSSLSKAAHNCILFIPFVLCFQVFCIPMFMFGIASVDAGVRWDLVGHI